MIRVQTMRFAYPEHLMFARGSMVSAGLTARVHISLEPSLSWQTEPLPMLESA